MNEDGTPIVIKSAPGIKRDGTVLEGEAYVDGQWVRFQRSLPRKIGGYHAINKYLREVSTALLAYTRNLVTYVHSGSANYVERFTITDVTTTSVISDRTPSAMDFTADDRNMWQFEAATKVAGGAPTLIIVAQVAPNAECICNDEGGELFYGDMSGTSALTAITPPVDGSATGGIVWLSPYLMVFGNDGYIGWSVAADPTDFASAGSGAANVTSQKVVRGLPLRGGAGAAPSGIFWSADAVIRATFVGGSEIFQFDTLSSQSSILSPRSVVEYDGIFFWIGVDRFLMFNGVVREVPNDFNANYFFDGINMNQRMKVFGFKNTRWGEIWWCYPRGDATECTHALIFNVRENVWYDTELPNSGRSAGLPPAVYRYPLMAGAAADERAQAYDVDSITAPGSGYAEGDILTVAGGGDVLQATQITVDGADSAGAITDVSITQAGFYGAAPADPVAVTGGSGSGATFDLTYVNPFKFWIHELGTDEVDGQTLQPINSFFETSDISFVLQSQPVNKGMIVELVEPDFVQVGPMTAQVRGRANSRAPEVNGDTITFEDTADTPPDQVVFFKEQRRQLRFRFGSNVIGGAYQMGSPIAHVKPGDGTTLG